MSNDPIDLDALTGKVAWSMIPPPPAVHQQLLHLFADRHGHAPRRQHAVAHRVDDRAPLLVRGDTVEKMVFTSELGDIVVDLDGDTVVGSVIPLVRPTPGAFSITAIDHPQLRSHEGGEDGSFRLAELPNGRQRLLLDNTHLEIEFEVEIGGDAWR